MLVVTVFSPLKAGRLCCVQKRKKNQSFEVGGNVYSFSRNREISKMNNRNLSWWKGWLSWAAQNPGRSSSDAQPRKICILELVTSFWYVCNTRRNTLCKNLIYKFICITTVCTYIYIICIDTMNYPTASQDAKVSLFFWIISISYLL